MAAPEECSGALAFLVPRCNLGAPLGTGLALVAVPAAAAVPVRIPAGTTLSLHMGVDFRRSATRYNIAQSPCSLDTGALMFACATEL